MLGRLDRLLCEHLWLLDDLSLSLCTLNRVHVIDAGVLAGLSHGPGPGVVVVHHGSARGVGHELCVELHLWLVSVGCRTS